MLATHGAMAPHSFPNESGFCAYPICARSYFFNSNLAPRREVRGALADTRLKPR